MHVSRKSSNSALCLPFFPNGVGSMPAPGVEAEAVADEGDDETHLPSADELATAVGDLKVLPCTNTLADVTAEGIPLDADGALVACGTRCLVISAEAVGK